MKKKCKIVRYDETCTKPPYLNIKLNEMEVNQPENDDGGVRFASILREGCANLGYQFKFYSMTDEENYDYEVFVFGPMEWNITGESPNYFL